ncbi:MAG TPA: ATP-binding cassette domain-containing protein [Pseudonocardiaceae bacterium]
MSAPLVELRGVGKRYGAVTALRGVSTSVLAGRVTCVLGDNGAGKSTVIKVIAGAHEHTEGTLLVDGLPRRFGSPRQALDLGIATVYQDLAVVALMPVWRNFFLGQELRRGPLLDVRRMRAVTREALAGMGIELRDVDRPVGTLSGGERQCVAIARAVHFGARVLVLDEPTAALGVKQSGVVLRHIAAARDRGLGVVLITHNPHHAWLVGDRFVVLRRGEPLCDAGRSELTLDDLVALMSGGAELDALRHELDRSARDD